MDKMLAITLGKNTIFHDRSKHTNTRYHKIRECIERNDVHVEFVKFQDQATDIFTKPLKHEYFINLRGLHGIKIQVYDGVLDYKYDLIHWANKGLDLFSV